MAYAMPQLEGVEHRFIRVGETSFHAAIAGEGEPVVCVHDWPQHWYAWRHVIPRLAESHRVVALDLRGFGWSDIAWRGFEIESLVDDLFGVLDGLELERVAYLGHGWGAWVGFAAALENPERIARMCALGIVPPWLRPGPAAAAALVRLRAQIAVATPFLGPQLCRRGPFVTHVARGLAGDPATLEEDALRLYARDLHASTRARAATLLNRAFLSRELPRALAGRYRRARLATPTLVLTGERGIARPAHVEAGPMPAGELRFEAVAGAGHLLAEERPELVAERALGFFGAGPAAGGEAALSAPAASS